MTASQAEAERARERIAREAVELDWLLIVIGAVVWREQWIVQRALIHALLARRGDQSPAAWAAAARTRLWRASTGPIAASTRRVRAALTRLARHWPTNDPESRATIRDAHDRWVTAIRGLNDAAMDAVMSAHADMQSGRATLDTASRTAARGIIDSGAHVLRDSAGKRWKPATFAEMRLRTAAQLAHTTTVLQAAADLDTPYVQVSDHHRECSRCLIPGTIVEGPVPTGRARTHYRGNVIRIRTARGNDLTGTPDHPVLTARGWVRLGRLKEGDQVVSYDREKGYAGVVPNDVQVPTRIEEAGESRLPILLTGPAGSDLDERVTYRKVRYVASNRDLTAEVDATLAQPIPDHLLVEGVRAAAPFLGPDDVLSDGVGQWLAAGSGVSGPEHAGALLGRGVGPSSVHAGADLGGPLFVSQFGLVADDADVLGAGLDTSASQVVGDAAAADPEGGPELLRSLAGKVALDEVVSLTVSEFEGHVWDISTKPEWFVANGIVTHNCRPWESRILRIDGVSDDLATATLDQARAAGLMHPQCRHQLGVYFPEWDALPPPGEPDPELYRASQQQRRYERDIREGQLRVEVEPPGSKARAAAQLAVGEARAGLAALLASNPRLRRSGWRETPRPGD